MNNINILSLHSPSGVEAHYGLESAGSARNLTFYMGVKLESGKNRRMPGRMIKFLRKQNGICHFEGAPGPNLPV
jgi:hypothetical protein